MRNHRVLGVVLVLLGVLLVANPLYVYQHPDEVNEVRVGNYFDRSPAANYTYEELSPRAQTVVKAAIESDDNATTFHGDERRPPEFAFAAGSTGDNVTAGAVYLVEYEGQQYAIETFESPRVVETETRRSNGLVALGVVIALAGGLYLWREQPTTLGMALGGVGVVLLGLNVASRYKSEVIGPLSVLGSSVFVLLGLLFAIASVGYLLYRTMRERRLETLTTT